MHSFQILSEFFKLTIKLFAVKLHAAAFKDTSEQKELWTIRVFFN